MRSLANGSLGAGSHTFTWDGADEAGTRVGSGAYFVRLTAGQERETSRIVVLR